MGDGRLQMSGGWTEIQDVGPSLVMPPGFGPYLPLPRGAGLAAEKGFLLRGWAQGRDGPESPSQGHHRPDSLSYPSLLASSGLGL